MRVYCYSKKTARRNGLGARLPVVCWITCAVLECAGIIAAILFERFRLWLLCAAVVFALLCAVSVFWNSRRQRLRQFAYAVGEDGAIYEISQFEPAKELAARMTADAIGEIIGLGSMAKGDSAISRISNLRKLMQSPEYIQSCVARPGSAVVRRLDDIKKVDESRKRYIIHCDAVNIGEDKKHSNQSVVLFKAYSRMDELMYSLRQELRS